MHPLAPRSERTIIRRVFAAWSITIPTLFEETFLERDGYWHAYDAESSVSLTSLMLDDGGVLVTAERILQEITPDLAGDPVDGVPAGLRGWAVTGPAIQPARASQMLSGIVVVDGRLLLATITSDDLAWARATWLSIRWQRPD